MSVPAFPVGTGTPFRLKLSTGVLMNNIVKKINKLAIFHYLKVIKYLLRLGTTSSDTSSAVVTRVDKLVQSLTRGL